MYQLIVSHIIRPGYAPHWPEFQLWVDIGKRLSQAAMDKRTAADRDADVSQVINSTLHQLGLAPGSWVRFKPSEFGSDWYETATPEYIRGLYRNAATPVEFDWDGVDGEGGRRYSPEDDDPSVIHPVFRYSTPPPTF
jgi:hypothetical protein